jgi:predicted double-glycine peptidase
MKKYLALIAAALVLIVFAWSALKRYEHPPLHTIEGFEPIEQPDGITCGPTSALMVLHWYGKDVSLDEVKAKTKTEWFEHKGESIGMTSPDYIPEAMKHFGVPAKMMMGNLDSLKYYVSQDRPVIVLLRSSKTTWHYVVVVGYDVGAVLLADPGPGKFKAVTNEWFLGAWSFETDMRGNQVVSDCALCNGTGEIVSNLGPLSECQLCLGTGKASDILVTLLHAAEVKPMTMIVPQRDI